MSFHVRTCRLTDPSFPRGKRPMTEGGSPEGTIITSRASADVRQGVSQ